MSLDVSSEIPPELLYGLLHSLAILHIDTSVNDKMRGLNLRDVFALEQLQQSVLVRRWDYGLPVIQIVAVTGGGHRDANTMQ